MIGKTEVLCHISHALARCKASLRYANPLLQVVGVRGHANRATECVCQVKAVDFCDGRKLGKRDVAVAMFR